ncbi:hypothetical protein JXA47_17160 [Candidatus Sumerlaeota bacterium]|nr:hypothetical protein [Candidatus Sumerlaeota bacterium]
MVCWDWPIGNVSPRIIGPVPEARADANQDGELTRDDQEWLLDFLLSSGE